ncbi:copper chaperone PCu(A)C [Bartonella apihabitans]|uniref:copper chaperone PCu(A)C n=1 Tax=Bartonella apihabitans TaxID=2750929 RepID=UPI0039974C1D
MSYAFQKCSILIRTSFAVLAAFACLFLSLSLGSAFANDYKIGDIEITNVWARATPNGAKVAGGFFTIVNHGKEADRLVSLSSELSDKAQIHSMEMTDGVMKMRHQADGVVIPAGGTVEFKPGSFHVMFMDLDKTLNKGDEFKAKMVFEKAGTVDVVFTVSGIGAQAPDSMPANHEEHQHH